MDIKTAISIVNRRCSIPEENETFDDINEAYDIVMDLCNKALNMIEPLSNIDDFER